MIYYHCKHYIAECNKKADRDPSNTHGCIVFRPDLTTSIWFLSGKNRNEAKFGSWSCWKHNGVNIFKLKDHPQHEDENGQLVLL